MCLMYLEKLGLNIMIYDVQNEHAEQSNMGTKMYLYFLSDPDAGRIPVG